ncbi:hypothetical protein C8R43DRAFT_1116718 [Mycena crocata]|nr:hypothetical protein C8R43DRAFT_1116718 [Mycena crocata]
MLQFILAFANPPLLEVAILSTCSFEIDGADPLPLYQQYFPPERGVSSITIGFCGDEEAIRFEFNPTKCTYPELLDFFYRTHDPTAGSRPDGKEKTSTIWTTSERQAEVAKECHDSLQKQHFDLTNATVMTKRLPALPWMEREEYLATHPKPAEVTEESDATKTPVPAAATVVGKA